MRISGRFIWKIAAGAAFLSVFTSLVEGVELMHVRWENLSMVTGRMVRVSLPEGTVTAKAVGVDAEALIVKVEKTTNRDTYPKGMMRVPRAKLHRLEMQTNSKTYRILLTSLGGGLGATLGIGVAVFAVEHCNIIGSCEESRPAASAGTVVGIAALGVAGGYLAGNSADKHWRTIEILEQAR